LFNIFLVGIQTYFIDKPTLFPPNKSRRHESQGLSCNIKSASQFTKIVQCLDSFSCIIMAEYGGQIK
jgi:hypothetical protein